MTDVFDLADIDIKADADAGAWLHLVDPRTKKPIYAGEEKPCELHIAGAHSKIAQKESEKQNRRRELRESRRYKQLIADGMDEAEARVKSKSTKEEIAEDNAEYYARITLGWKNLAFNGKTEPDYETLKAMYLAREWIGGQVFLFLGKLEAFIRKPQKSSSSTHGKAPTSTRRKGSRTSKA